MSKLSAIAALGTGTAALLGLQSKDAEAGIYGTSANMADKMMLNIAQKMKAEGINPEQIWRKTRWFEDPVDGNWKFEVPDNDAQWHPNMIDPKTGNVRHRTISDSDGARYAIPTEMPKAFSNDNLYYNYPDIESGYYFRHMPENSPEYAKGEHSRRGMEIRTNPNLSAESQRSTMLHEMQHAVQTREGWQPGSNPDNFTVDYLESLKKEYADKYRKFDNTRKALIEFENGLKRDPSNESLMRASNSFRNQAAKYRYELAILEDKIPHADPQSQYMAMAGEVEARNVQSRDALRSAYDEHEIGPPWNTVSHSPSETYRHHAESPAWSGHKKDTVGKSVGLSGIAGMSALSAKANAALDTLKYGEIKAPEYPALLDIASGLEDISRRMEGHPLKLLTPGLEGLPVWLRKLAYKQKPTTGDTFGAILDVL